MSKELLQQALDFLGRVTHWQEGRPDLHDMKVALREALAAPQPEPVADLYQHGETGRTRVVMRGECADMAATWDLIGPLFLAAPPAAPAPAVPSFDRTTALVLLQAASKSGDPGAISLAAQLTGAAPCKDCGYVNFKCRCPSAAPAVREPQDEMDAFEKWWEEKGQFGRSGGGQYEKSFAWAAWQAHGLGGGGK